MKTGGKRNEEKNSCSSSFGSGGSCWGGIKNLFEGEKIYLSVKDEAYCDEVAK